MAPARGKNYLYNRMRNGVTNAEVGVIEGKVQKPTLQDVTPLAQVEQLKRIADSLESIATDLSLIRRKM